MSDEVPGKRETSRGRRTSNGQNDYLHPREVAQLLCVTARTVSRWADQGRIPHILTLGGHRRFRRADVEKLLGDTDRSEGSSVS